VSLKLSILDQSPVLSSGTPAQAIQATLDLARRAEELGYCRYWLAEHHAIAALADPCPEVLLARLGAETKRMRIGTGGVLLPYYSAFKVAEVFRMLVALYPDRVDLGIGRAPGGDARTAHAVAGGQFPSADDFPQRVWELVGHLDGTLPDDHPHKRVRVQPVGKASPEVWLLGSSDYSGLLAARRHWATAAIGSPSTTPLPPSPTRAPRCCSRAWVRRRNACASAPAAYSSLTTARSRLPRSFACWTPFTLAASTWASAARQAATQ